MKQFINVNRKQENSMKNSLKLKTLSVAVCALLQSTNAFAIDVCHITQLDRPIEPGVAATLKFAYQGSFSGNVAVTLQSATGTDQLLRSISLGKPPLEHSCIQTATTSITIPYPQAGSCISNFATPKIEVKGNEGDPVYQQIELKNATKPVINNISRMQGEVGTTITISGSNFFEDTSSASPGQSTVYFNGVEAQTTYVSANQLTAKVPAGATTGHIEVKYKTADYSYCDFATSASKFIVDNVYDNQRAMVQQAYTDILGRAATEREVDNWVNQPQGVLSNTDTPVDLYNTLLDSTVLDQIGFVGRTYRAMLARSPDVSGIGFYVNQLQSGVTELSIVSGFYHSPEFQAKYGALTDRNFVILVYQNVLQRTPGEPEITYYVNRLTLPDLTRAEMMLAFISSEEYKLAQNVAQQADLLSLTISDELPTQVRAATYKRWISEEGNGTSVARALLASDAYRVKNAPGKGESTLDSDGDEISDGVEYADGTEIHTADNNVIDNDLMFVKQVLRDMVGPLSINEIQAQINEQAAMNDRTQWVTGLMTSDWIAKGRQPIVRLYNAFFLRQPEHNGLMYWISRMDSDLALDQIPDFFMVSQEFVNRYGSLNNADFVTLVYKNVLGRVPDPEGHAYWAGRLDSGEISRGTMMLGFSESDEYINNTKLRDQIVLSYNLLLRRVPTDNEYTTWANDGDIANMINAIINSNEFLLRFN